MRYFEWRGSRLFRLDEDNTGARWDEETRSWKTLPSDLVFRETVVSPSPDYTEISAQDARVAYPGSQRNKIEEPGDDIDWPFSVEMMGKIMAAVSSGYGPAQFIEDHDISDAVAPYVARFWNMISEANAGLPPGHSISPPTEWN